jgi:hypothetical protein
MKERLGASLHVNLRYRNANALDAIRQRDAIFRFSRTDNFDPSLSFPNI